MSQLLGLSSTGNVSGMSRTREGRQCSARTAPGWERTERSPAWVKVIGTPNEELEEND